MFLTATGCTKKDFFNTPSLKMETDLCNALKKLGKQGEQYSKLCTVGQKNCTMSRKKFVLCAKIFHCAPKIFILCGKKIILHTIKLHANTKS